MAVKRTTDLPVQAGVYTEQTDRGAQGKYKDSDKVRFRKGLPEKIGGWQRFASVLLKGLARRIWDWASLDGRLWSAIGTESKLYLLQGVVLYDITPLRRAVKLTDPFTTVNGSDIVTVNDPSHGAQQGDFVKFESASPVGGITIDGEYQIQTIVDIDNYTIQDDQTATANAVGGGGVDAEYDISVGLTNTSFGTGWGTGTWSQETWSTPRSISTTIAALRTWSLDNWGEDLIANPRLGGMYWWDRNTGPTSRAVILDGAPARSAYMIISQRDRHIFALGCTDEFTGEFDPLLIRWCSKEDFNDWVPTSTNTAGDLRIFRGSQLVTAVRTRGEILVFTDISVHQINFLGGTTVFGLTVAGENVSILGPNAAIEVDYRVFFMAEGDFYVYDGVLRPLRCDVRNLVYENLNIFQKDKAFAALNREFNEIWFFYPGKDENVWVESDFTSGALSGAYAVQSMNGGPFYAVGFNAGGYTEVTSDNTINYDLVYLADNTAVIETPTDWDLEVTFSFVNGINNRYFGAIINAEDLDGGTDTNGDNVEGLTVEMNPGLNFIRLYKRNIGADQQLANGSTGVDLSTLPTPVTLQDGVEYGLTITRTATQVKATLFDPVTDTKQTVETVTLSAAEQAQFDQSGYGALLGSKGILTNYENVVRLTGLRAAPADVLVNQAGTGTVDEVNRYVLYNYEEETWAVGSLERTAWRDRSPVFNDPYAAGVDGRVYIHERGVDDDGQPMDAFLETYDMEIPEAGEYLMHVDKLIPDFLTLEGQVDIYLRGRKYPQSPQIQKGPYPVVPGTGKISARIRARQISLRMESNRLGDKWRSGTLRARVRPHGRRA